MNIERVSLALLRDSAQPRDLVQANVDMLRASIEQVGLIQPIRVRPAGVIVRGLGEQGFQIVAGHHRVAAARALGWTEIDAIVDTAEHLQAELMEIDENLCRAELTASQRAQAIRRRKQIWEALHPAGIQVAQVGSPEIGYGKPPAQEHGFATSTASVSGESKTAINRHLARAEAIGDDLERVTGTSLDKGVELDALAKLPEPERKDLIARAEAGEEVSARKTTAVKRESLEDQLCSVINEAVERILAVVHADSIAEFADAVNDMPEAPRKRVESALMQLELIGTLCANVEV